MSEIADQVGAMIRDARKQKGITQKELGLRLGVAEPTVTRYKKGQNLTVETLSRIGTALGVKLILRFE